MAIPHRSKKKKRNKTKEPKATKVGSFESTGVIFQKVAHTKRNLRTDIHSWPSCIVAGYDDSKQSIYVDYNYSADATDQVIKDIHELTAFFGDMAEHDTFTILNASYDDSIGKPTKTIEGTYKLLSYDNGRLSAEKKETLDANFVMKKLSGRNFAKPLQYEKETELNSTKKISSITNWVNHPKFSNLNIEIGDQLEPVGTSFNDLMYIVLDIIEHNDGSEEIKVSPEINENENRIGKITAFNHYRYKVANTRGIDEREALPLGQTDVPRDTARPVYATSATRAPINNTSRNASRSGSETTPPPNTSTSRSAAPSSPPSSSGY